MASMPYTTNPVFFRRQYALSARLIMDSKQGISIFRHRSCPFLTTVKVDNFVNLPITIHLCTSLLLIDASQHYVIYPSQPCCRTASRHLPDKEPSAVLTLENIFQLVKSAFIALTP